MCVCAKGDDFDLVKVGDDNSDGLIRRTKRFPHEIFWVSVCGLV